MSRRRDDYENSWWRTFKNWVNGEIDLLAVGMEIQTPKELTGKENETAKKWESKKALPWEKDKTESWNPDKEEENFQNMRGIRLFRRFYQVMSVILCMSIIFVLLWTVAYLPAFGNAGNPDNNEVSARYIERGLQETGAVNIVTGMILDYRAFDTFGESCVLFIASCCVLALLRIDVADKKGHLSNNVIIEKNKKELGKGTEPGNMSWGELAKRRLEASNDRLFEPKNDLILQKCACVLVPLIFVFGIYIVLNGHLSPGGGFSGGAVLGSGLILYLNAFGFKKTEEFFTEKVYRRLTLLALTFYCVAKSYSFFTGANHLDSGIPLGTPGAILSSGLILPLNICVGLVVACTMYAFYALFRKGGM